jgi:hypothetical protein
MKNVQAVWKRPRDVRNDGARHLHVAPRTEAPGPRWGLLYAALGVIAVAGTAAHFLAMKTALVQVVDAGFGLGLFVTLAGWVHMNRVAIMRAAEPEPVPARARVRIVRPRERAADETYADDGIVRLGPDERVVLPYDFR